MAGEVYYSKPLKYFWQLYRTHKKDGIRLTGDHSLTDDEVFDSIRKNLLYGPMRIDEIPETRGLSMSGLELWREDSKGELLHIYFLDRQLRDFLVDTPLSDLDNIKKYLFENGKINNVFHYYSNKLSEHVTYKFALHVPNEVDGYAFSLSIEEDGAVELYFSQGENGGRMSDKFLPDMKKKDDESSLTISKMYRLAINTIAYMKCFPDCVTDGVPKNLFEGSGDKDVRSFTFRVSEKVKENTNMQMSRIPHFRKGHFRYLQSDYFSNKKGQFTFVTETMVKGKAKTVSMSTDIDDFTS